MNFEIVITDHFERELKKLAKKYRSVKNDLADLINSLKESPTQGTSIAKDCYKIRMAITSKRERQIRRSKSDHTFLCK